MGNRRSITGAPHPLAGLYTFELRIPEMLVSETIHGANLVRALEGWVAEQDGDTELALLERGEVPIEATLVQFGGMDLTPQEFRATLSVEAVTVASVLWPGGHEVMT